MSTNFTIAVVHDNGSIDQIYGHWDGYLKGAGKILLEYYNSKELAKELISMGNLSVLGKYLNPIGNHSFSLPEKDVCVFYHRDRGELLDMDHFDNYEYFLKQGNIEEYNYLFKDNQWLVDIHKEWPNPNIFISLKYAFLYEYNNETDENILFS